MSSRFVPGIVLNAIAGLAVLLSVPWLFAPVWLMLFAGVLAAPLLLFVLVVALALIFLSPVAGTIMAVQGGARTRSVGAALTSMVSLAALVAVVRVAGLDDGVQIGWGARPPPAGCVVRAADASAIAQRCELDGGAWNHGCPEGYVCMDVTIPQPRCQILCQYDCECPPSSRCLNWRCAP